MANWNKHEEIFWNLTSDGLVRIFKQAREDRKLTQAGLANKLGINQSTIAKIEAGQVDLPLSRLIEMSRVLGLEIALIPKEKVVLMQALLKSTRREKSTTFKDLLGVDETEEF